MKSNTPQIDRVRRICTSLPECEERLSHGEPTWFVRKKVFCGFSNNHHNDGHVAVLLPVPEGMQALLIEDAPETYYRPPYVGVKGWVGVELARIGDPELASLVRGAWKLVAPKKLMTAI